MGNRAEKAAAIKEPLNQRLHDLVRYHRMELYMEGLITQEEYIDLATEGRGPVERLQDYDALRREIVGLKQKLADRVDAHDRDGKALMKALSENETLKKAIESDSWFQRASAAEIRAGSAERALQEAFTEPQVRTLMTRAHLQGVIDERRGCQMNWEERMDLNIKELRDQTLTKPVCTCPKPEIHAELAGGADKVDPSRCVPPGGWMPDTAKPAEPMVKMPLVSESYMQAERERVSSPEHVAAVAKVEAAEKAKPEDEVPSVIHPACTAKHTKYQPPLKDWKCPNCGKPPPEGLCCDDGPMSECEMLHEDDYLRCYACNAYNSTGKAFAAKMLRQSQMVPCPTCKTKGFVPGKKEA